MSMLTQEKINAARQVVERITGRPAPQARVAEGPGLTLRMENGGYTIVAEDANALARGYFLLADAAETRRSLGHLRQERHFSACGIMLDMSRNAVLTVEAVCRVMDRMAALGMNLLLLYMEDTYTIPEYPSFGRLRGRYAPEELRQMDEYAALLDIDLVPCIQTLGHMEQFLQWDSSAPLRDQRDILMIGSPDTEQLIEAAIRSLRGSLRTRRIHIGMDEAAGVGLGRYYLRHGIQDRFQLMNRHVRLVADICRRYGFEPMMWSDMYFKLGSARQQYYDPEAHVPDGVIGSLPDISWCYWDYYHTDPAVFDHMLREHERMGKTVFAGGIWTWSGFMPNIKRTAATMAPALRVCSARRVDTVFATMWGDDGAETDPFLALPQLTVFSEACWQGTDAEGEARLGARLTGIPEDTFRAMADFYLNEQDIRTGKSLIWCDPLLPTIAMGEPLSPALDRYRQALGRLNGSSPEISYARLCFRVALLKGEWLLEARPHYLAGDRTWLERAVACTLPELRMACEDLMRAHRLLWDRDCKRFGWEVLDLRYGGLLARLNEAEEQIRRWLAGEISLIAELEEEPPQDRRYAASFYHALATPNYTLSGI